MSRPVRGKISRSVLAALLGLPAFACDSSSAPSAGAPAPTAAGAASTARSPARPAPDFTLKDVDGKIWKLSDLRGKGIVLSFWFLG